MDNIIWLMATNLLIWCGLGLYCLFLSVKQKQIIKQLNQLELIQNGK